MSANAVENIFASNGFESIGSGDDATNPKDCYGDFDLVHNPKSSSVEAIASSSSPSISTIAAFMISFSRSGFASFGQQGQRRTLKIEPPNSYPAPLNFSRYCCVSCCEVGSFIQASPSSW